MRRSILAAVLISVACFHRPLPVRAQESRLPAPAGWLYVQSESRTMVARPGLLKGKPEQLSRGSLVPVFNTKRSGGARWAEVRVFRLDTASPQAGWVEVGQNELQPAETYPRDGELLRQLGDPYLDDFTAAHTHVARFLLRQGQNPPILLCYIYADPLPVAKLVAFATSQGKFLLAAARDYPISNIKAGITSLEIRDLLGGGMEFLITREPFQQGPETNGTNLVIRRLEGNQFHTLWQAPVEFHNLSAFTFKIQILQPPEKNIGAPGTVTRGEVTFRPQGSGQEPVWKGKVEFFAFGREQAVDSVTFERECPWEGKEFAPLR